MHYYAIHSLEFDDSRGKTHKAEAGSIVTDLSAKTVAEFEAYGAIREATATEIVVAGFELPEAESSEKPKRRSKKTKEGDAGEGSGDDGLAGGASDDDASNDGQDDII